MHTNTSRSKMEISIEHSFVAVVIITIQNQHISIETVNSFG